MTPTSITETLIIYLVTYVELFLITVKVKAMACKAMA